VTAADAIQFAVVVGTAFAAFLSYRRATKAGEDQKVINKSKADREDVEAMRAENKDLREELRDARRELRLAGIEYEKARRQCLDELEAERERRAAIVFTLNARIAALERDHPSGG